MAGTLHDADLVDGLTIVHMKVTGFWKIVNDYRATGRKNTVFTAYMALSCILYGPLAVFCTIGLFHIEPTIQGISLCILHPISLVQAFVKISVFWLGLETQARLFNVFKSDFLENVPKNEKNATDEIIRKRAARTSRIVKTVIFVNVFTILWWVVLPILRSEFFRFTLGVTFLGVPKTHNSISEIWVPVDSTISPWTETVYCYEAGVAIFGASVITLLGSLIVQLFSMLTANMEALAYLLNRLNFSNFAAQNPGETRDEVFRRMRQQMRCYVTEHQKLMKAGEDLKTLYSALISVQLATGLIILVISIFNFFLGSDDGDLVELSKFSLYLLSTVIEVTLYCNSGKALEEMSENLGLAAYGSEWYFMDPKDRRSIHMMISRSRKPVLLKAAGIWPINLTTLKALLQVAYSTSMLLYRVSHGEKGLA